MRGRRVSFHHGPFMRGSMAGQWPNSIRAMCVLLVARQHAASCVSAALNTALQPQRNVIHWGSWTLDLTLDPFHASGDTWPAGADWSRTLTKRVRNGCGTRHGLWGGYVCRFVPAWDNHLLLHCTLCILVVGTVSSCIVCNSRMHLVIHATMLS